MVKSIKKATRTYNIKDPNIQYTYITPKKLFPSILCPLLQKVEVASASLQRKWLRHLHLTLSTVYTLLYQAVLCKNGCGINISFKEVG